MSNFLAIDTSSRYLTVLAVKDEKTALRHLPDCAMQHSVVLMDEIDKALKEVNLAPAGCDFFAAVTGPGSFTGIRIGVATAKGFALATGKPLVSVTAFNLIAYNVNIKKFYIIIDALHSHYYVCGYENGQISLPPCYMNADGVKNLDAPLYGFEQIPLENYQKIDIKNCLYPAVCALKNGASGEMHALYVRKSQAEEARSGN